MVSKLIFLFFYIEFCFLRCVLILRFDNLYYILIINIGEIKS